MTQWFAGRSRGDLEDFTSFDALSLSLRPPESGFANPQAVHYMRVEKQSAWK